MIPAYYAPVVSHHEGYYNNIERVSCNHPSGYHKLFFFHTWNNCSTDETRTLNLEKQAWNIQLFSFVLKCAPYKVPFQSRCSRILNAYVVSMISPYWKAKTTVMTGLGYLKHSSTNRLTQCYHWHKSFRRRLFRISYFYKKDHTIPSNASEQSLIDAKR